jgi:hypothetical protein
MNRQQLEKIRNENWNKLNTQSFRPAINAVEFNPFSESLEHFLVKAFLCYQIRRGVPLEILKKESEKENLLITLFDNPRKFYPYYEKFKSIWQISEIVTEARFKNQRRADIFILKTINKDSGMIAEVETNKKISKDGNETVTFYI